MVDLRQLTTQGVSNLFRLISILGDSGLAGYPLAMDAVIEVVD